MTHDGPASRCHLAALRQDLVPPDPRLHLTTVAPHELALSLGSLAFLRDPNEPHSRRKTDGRRDSAPSDCSGSTDAEHCIHGGDIHPRKTAITLRSALYINGEQVSDTVTVHLNRGRIAGFREVFSGTPGSGSRRIKHRHTFEGGSSRRPLSGSNFIRCKLLPRGSGLCVFRVKRQLKYRTAAPTVTEEPPTDKSWYATIVDRQPTNQRNLKSNIPASITANAQRRPRWSCHRCRPRPVWQAHRISVPIIVRIDTLLRFQMWNKFRNGCAGFTLRNEIDVDGDFLARSELDITLRGNSPNCFVGMFYDREPQVFDAATACDIRSCCCSAGKRVVCASHLLRISDEVKRVISFIFRHSLSTSARVLEKYRHLLYFYLQMLSFSRNQCIATCVDALPVAVVTVGLVEFDDSVTSEIAPDKLPLRLVMRYKCPQPQVPPNTPNYAPPSSHCGKPASLQGSVRADHDPSFETSQPLQTNRTRRHRVGIVYMGEGRDESRVIHNANHRVSITNLPVYGMPAVLSRLLDSTFYSDDYIVCPMMVETLCINSSVFVPGGGVAFLPEPRELSFLQCLISTPLYSVGIAPGTLDSSAVTASFGSIGYRQINEWVWRYQPLLAKSGDALCTFLRFVDWGSESESEAALRALPAWREPGLASLLELLSRDFAPPIMPGKVQAYACRVLAKNYKVHQLAPFFPQLVVAPGSRRLIHHLIHAASAELCPALHLYWALEAWSKSRHGHSEPLARFLSAVEANAADSAIWAAIKSQRVLRQRLHVLMQHLKSNTRGHRDQTVKLAAVLSSHDRLELFHGLSPREDSNACITFDAPVPLFTDPSLRILSVDTDRCSVIKTSRYPLLLALHVGGATEGVDGNSPGTPASSPDGAQAATRPSHHNTTLLNYVYKHCDDLRLDQVCQQAAKLADSILRSHGVESYIESYQVLSTSSRDGFVEFLMDTKSLSAVLADHGSVAAYVLGDHPSPVDALCKRLNFAGSLASYSVLTYLLGVGDRHNDNLILSRSGHVVHVDYAYVLGSDPKPLPLPPFKLSREMLDFLGGRHSFFYRLFEERFYLVFSVLRRHAKLFIILLYLLVDCDLRSVDFGALVQMESRFHLSDSSPSALRQHVHSLVEASTTALSAALSEKWHQLSMMWK
ncbi:phosphatidylinositol 3-kinase [Babesia caballi]|uniref:Phosphatidylinositol 3-kinase n=1 Tax=Babesia caballi TaxID=5871 RepID=A0AAV4M087_BABCB|nr:phosphatidylinositol 3-kinase [Babesia caballi]